ncbi:MAG: helix-turn-helix transcriptional regulator [Lachnospiraceae bacterium]|nr:helix-turn-helix transcriptional regulator [Lachnospiraceae bacterium]
MTMAQKINMAVVYKGISQAALARAIDMTPSILTKTQREPFSTEELSKIAEALGGVYEFGFTFVATVHQILLLKLYLPVTQQMIMFANSTTIKIMESVNIGL